MTIERQTELKEVVHDLMLGKIPSLEDIYGLLQVLDEVEVAK